MRGALGWQCTSDPVDETWKRNLLYWIGQELSVKTFVDLCGWRTAAALCLCFPEVYAADLAKMSRPDFLSTLDGRVLFWIDGHKAEGTSVGFGDGSLVDELRDIDEIVGPDRAVVAIDGQHGTELPLVMARGVTLLRWTREYRTGIVLLYGALKVPPFEEDRL